MPFEAGLNDSGQAYLSVTGLSIGSELMTILETESIDPGSDPGYQACKILYTNHPLGARIVDKPLQMAFSQKRVITIPGSPEKELMQAFNREWGRIGTIGGDNLIYRAVQLSQIYGISTLAVNIMGADGKKAPTNEPLPMDEIWRQELYFSLFDPLNTAGSLVLNQDPAAPDFLKPQQVSVGTDSWSGSKTLVLMHEQPVWIKWTTSAFGFVGRSVFQRAFYPLKSFVLSMLADQMVQEKLGLIVYKSVSPSAIVDMAARAFKAMQRTAIKGARTNQVVSIGDKESLESLNMEHIQGAGEYSRSNIIKNIALGTGRPASLLTQESLAEGFGEGTEDAKQIAQFIDRLRMEMQPAFRFMDNLVQHRAWNPVFYKDMKRKYPEIYGNLSYKAAFQSWQDAWTAEWPNLLTEPDSEKIKKSQLKIDGAVKIATLLMAGADPENKAAIMSWLADTVNDEKDFYSSPLVLDEEAIAKYMPEPREEPL